MVRHEYKNFALNLPNNWLYEKEEGDIEACFDPTSKSTLRIHLMKLRPPVNASQAEKIKVLTGGLQYTFTDFGYMLTIANVFQKHKNNDIDLITWRIIKLPENGEADIALLSYTVLSVEKDSEKERGIINDLEKSFKEAVFN